MRRPWGLLLVFLLFEGDRVFFLCERSLKSILAIKFAWSPSPIILAIGSLSSILDEWGFRGLPRWHLVFSGVRLSWEGDSFVIGCIGNEVKGVMGIGTNHTDIASVKLLEFSAVASSCRRGKTIGFFGCVSAIYWNNALHWLETENRQLTHYKLNIEDHEHPIITTIQIYQGLQQERNFFESYGNMLPMIITIQILHMLHLEGKLFELRGFLLHVHRDYIGSSEFTIYEMRKWCSVWSIKYLIDTDDFMSKFPEGWSIRLHEIYDMGSNQVADDYLDGFILPFAMYDMGSKNVDHKVYEFIPSSASV
ncbi:hypothetical protein Tco_1344625 [Tanacetum coccineum]